jgi:hypothetical protein
MTLGLMIAFCLPYGDRTPWYGKCLTACAFVAPTAFLGFSWWQIITPAAFIGMFYASRNKITEHVFPWKVVEFLTGCFLGTLIATIR